jgi:hypothetical protein
MRRFGSTCTFAKNRSMSIDLPRPTGPWMYSPLWRRGLAGEAEHGPAPCRHPCLEVVSHPAECGSHTRLRGVACQLTFGDERVVSLNWVHARS